MSKSMTRRAILRGSPAAIAVAAAITLSAIAEASDGDTELLDLERTLRDGEV